jgi:hypothetical protein
MPGQFMIINDLSVLVLGSEQASFDIRRSEKYSCLKNEEQEILLRMHFVTVLFSPGAQCAVGPEG